MPTPTIPTVEVGTGNQEKVVQPVLLTGIGPSGELVPLKADADGKLLAESGASVTTDELVVTTSVSLPADTIFEGNPLTGAAVGDASGFNYGTLPSYVIPWATLSSIRAGLSSADVLNPAALLGFSMFPGYIDCTGLISTHLTSATSGTGAAATSSIYSIKLSTPTTAVGHAYSRLSSASSFLTQRTTLVQQSFSSPFFIAFRIRDQTTDSSGTWRVTFGKNFTSTVGSLANKGIGVTKTGTGALILTAHNGTSLVNSTSTFTPASINQVFDCLLYSDGNGNVTLYVNDTQVATNSNGPTGSEGLVTPTLFMEIENTSTSSAQSHIEIGRPRLLFV